MQRAFKFTQSASRSAFKTCVASAPINGLKSSSSAFTAAAFQKSSIPATNNSANRDGLINNNKKDNSVSSIRNVNQFGISELTILLDGGDDDGG